MAIQQQRVTAATEFQRLFQVAPMTKTLPQKKTCGRLHAII
jgi:hypothetical protein